MNPQLLWSIFQVLFGLAVGSFLVLRISKRTEWYLPAITVAKLSNELRTELQAVLALNETYRDLTSDVATAHKQLVEFLEQVEYSRDALLTVLESQLRGQFQHIHEDVVRQISRDLSARLATHMVELFNANVSFGSEYVLLHDISDFHCDVKLDARYQDPAVLVSAINRALEYTHLKLPDVRDDRTRADWLLRYNQNRSQFEMFLGKVGEELFNLQWQGAVALRRETPLALKNRTKTG